MKISVHLKWESIADLDAVDERSRSTDPDLRSRIELVLFSSDPPLRWCSRGLWRWSPVSWPWYCSPPTGQAASTSLASPQPISRRWVFFFSPFVSFDLSMASFLVCSLDLVRYDLYDGIWFLPLLLLFIRCETIDFSFQIENWTLGNPYSIRKKKSLLLEFVMSVGLYR